MTDFITTLAEEFAQHIAEKRNFMLKQAIRNTNWDETPVVDFVWAGTEPEHGAKMGEMPRMKHPTSRVVRHDGPAPPVQDSTIRGRRCEIYRMTRPYLENIGINPDTGERADTGEFRNVSRTRDGAGGE